MKVFIPSRSRPEKIDQLLRQLPPEVQHNATVIVPEGQFEQYAPKILTASIETVPDDWRIARIRQLIGSRAEFNGHRHFVMVDDDVQFLVRRTMHDFQLVKADPGQVAGMLGIISTLFREHPRVSHIGVSGREGNNRVGNGGPWDLVEHNTRTMRVVAWDTAEFNVLQHCRVEVMEDFDLSLQSLERGRENRVLYYWANGQTATHAPGGCADWRTREIHDASALQLAELHPMTVRTRLKQNMTGPMPERLEVTVQWKRAAELGASRNGR